MKKEQQTTMQKQVQKQIQQQIQHMQQKPMTQRNQNL